MDLTELFQELSAPLLSIIAVLLAFFGKPKTK